MLTGNAMRRGLASTRTSDSAWLVLALLLFVSAVSGTTIVTKFVPPTPVSLTTSDDGSGGNGTDAPTPIPSSTTFNGGLIGSQIAVSTSSSNPANMEPGTTMTCSKNTTATCATLSVAIGAAAGGTVCGMLLMFLFSILILKHRIAQTAVQPAPSDTSGPTTQNVAYESADVEMTETPMTSSDAYGVLEVSPQPNYDYIQPEPTYAATN